MVSPKERYLREVLGIQSMVMPVGAQLAAETMAETGAMGNPDAEALALVDQPITGEVFELLQKMFGSVGISDFYAAQSSTEISLASRKVVWLFGKSAVALDFENLYQLPSLAQLMSDQPAVQQKAKRQAWDKIKTLK